MLKPELQAKFLQHLNQKKKGDEGFTLIELLVVVIIIGVLAAIALPSLLGQVNKAKQAEAKQNVGSLNRAQQAYFLEQGVFATDIAPIGIGIKTQTTNFKYTIDNTKATSNTITGNIAVAVKPALKSYIGIVGTTEGDKSTSEVLSLAVACESDNPTQATPAALAEIKCPGQYHELAK